MTTTMSHESTPRGTQGPQKKNVRPVRASTHQITLATAITTALCTKMARQCGATRRSETRPAGPSVVDDLRDESDAPSVRRRSWRTD